MYAGYLAQTLEHLGAGEVFLDVEGMELGEDFVERIHHEVGRCDVLMVLIGKEWLCQPDAEGRPRLWDPLDWVHVEIRAALDRSIPVIPLLVGGAAMPAPEQLPEPLRKLAFRHGTTISEAKWQTDVADLASRLPIPRSASSRAVPPHSLAGTSGAPVLGWTPVAAAELYRRLVIAGNHVQAGTILAETQSDGWCDRSQVYRLGRFPADRSLKGFTRPVARLRQVLEQEGVLLPDAANPMQPVYDAADGTQKADGFRMPAELVPVFRQGLPSRAGTAPVPALEEPSAVEAVPAAGLLEEHLRRLGPSARIADLVTRVAQVRDVRSEQRSYVSIAPVQGRGIALYVHLSRIAVALPPDRAEEVPASLPNVRLDPRSHATTYVLVDESTLVASFDDVLALALEAVDWRTR